ncbi:hypothetical protein [Psychroserpens mesophilus]|uniref:hypothetical protein n=1 Tax=Psychroserpens mesophilus TaxID=325473 RepID=UPI003D652E7B
MSKPKFTITDLFGNDTKFISYTLNGKTVIRRSSAPSKERINTDPAYHKVKMNNQEFAAATALSKAIRNQNLKTVFQTFKDTYMAGRLTGVCRKIIQQGSGELGKREACIATNGSILEQFPLNKQRPLGYTVKVAYQLQTTPNRDTITMSTSIAKANLTGQPKTATHVQLTLALATVSKHKFNTKTKNYQPEHPSQNALGVYIQSQPIAISNTPIPVNLETSVPFNEPLANTTAVVVALGISFSSLENNTMYELKSANAMNIIKIL